MTFRRPLLCISLANLFFLDEWDSIASRWENVATPSPPHPTLAQFFAPVLLAVLALALVFWIVTSLVPRAWQWLCLFGLLIPLSLLRLTTFHLERYQIEEWIGRPVMIAIVALLAFAALYWRRKFLWMAGMVPLLLAPLLPLQFAYSAWRYFHLPPASVYHGQPSAALLQHEPESTRVIWLLFDELDQSVLFDQRPASVSLPEFDRLRRESLYFDHVSPAGANTIESMPTLLSGRTVVESRRWGPGDLLIKFAGDAQLQRWSTVRNIFDDVRQQGFNSAVVAGELPYCRALGHSLASCDGFPSRTTEIALERPSVLERTWYLLRTRPFFFPFIGALPASRALRAPLLDAETRRESRIGEASSYDRMRRRAAEVAVDQRFQLILMHWPAPHLLGFYDRRSGVYATADTSSYLDNLALADRTLGEIRAALERAGLWDCTTLLVTADHPLRNYVIESASWWKDPETVSLKSEARRYVPLMIKIPGRAPAESHAPFSALRIHDLVPELLSGDPHI